MVFENGVKTIQAAAYNGARTVSNPLFEEDGASQIFHFEMLKYLHKNIEEDFISGLH